MELSDIVNVGGSDVVLRDVVLKMRAGDPDASRLIVSQIRTERDADSRDSLGLTILTLAFERIVQSWLTKVFFDGREDLADEAWNDALLTAWRRINQFDTHRSSFRTWFFNLAKWSAMSILRTEERAAMRVQRVAEVETADDVYDSLEEYYSYDEKLNAALERAMARLTDAQRRYVQLRVVHGLSHSEISQHLGGSVPTDHVRVYVNRAIRRLRAIFEEEVVSH